MYLPAREEIVEASPFEGPMKLRRHQSGGIDSTVKSISGSMEEENPKKGGGSVSNSPSKKRGKISERNSISSSMYSGRSSSRRISRGGLKRATSGELSGNSPSHSFSTSKIGVEWSSNNSNSMNRPPSSRLSVPSKGSSTDFGHMEDGGKGRKKASLGSTNIRLSLKSLVENRPIFDEYEIEDEDPDIVNRGKNEDTKNEGDLEEEREDTFADYLMKMGSDLDLDLDLDMEERTPSPQLTPSSSQITHHNPPIPDIPSRKPHSHSNQSPKLRVPQIPVESNRFYKGSEFVDLLPILCQGVRIHKTNSPFFSWPFILREYKRMFIGRSDLGVKGAIFRFGVKVILYIYYYVANKLLQNCGIL